jgi:hypothetical protein
MEGAEAIRCREFRSKAYPCQESESALVEGSVVPPQIRGLGVCVEDEMRWEEYGT